MVPSPTRRPAVIPVIILIFIVVPTLSFATVTEDMWLLGFGLNWADIGATDRTENASTGDLFIDDTGIGGTITAGYGFGPALAFSVEGSATDHNTSSPDVDFFFSSLVGEMLYIFRDMETWRPYILGGIGVFAASSRENAFEYDVTGTGLSVGGGFYYFFTDHFSLDGCLRGDFISWGEEKARVTLANGTTLEASAPIDDSGSTARISAAASWWF